MLRRQRRKIGATKLRGRFTNNYFYKEEDLINEDNIRTDCII